MLTTVNFLRFLVNSVSFLSLFCFVFKTKKKSLSSHRCERLSDILFNGMVSACWYPKGLHLPGHRKLSQNALCGRLGSPGIPVQLTFLLYPLCLLQTPLVASLGFSAVRRRRQVLSILSRLDVLHGSPLLQHEGSSIHWHCLTTVWVPHHGQLRSVLLSPLTLLPWPPYSYFLVPNSAPSIQYTLYTSV